MKNTDGNSDKIRLEKLDVMGDVVETIELDGRWKITTGEKNYFMNSKYIDEMKVDLEKIQNNFIDNLTLLQMKTKNEQFAVYEKKPAKGKEENGIILAPFNTKEEAEQAMIKYGYNIDNYYVDELK